MLYASIHAFPRRHNSVGILVFYNHIRRVALFIMFQSLLMLVIDILLL